MQYDQSDYHQRKARFNLRDPNFEANEIHCDLNLGLSWELSMFAARVRQTVTDTQSRTELQLVIFSSFCRLPACEIRLDSFHFYLANGLDVNSLYCNTLAPSILHEPSNLLRRVVRDHGRYKIQSRVNACRHASSSDESQSAQSHGRALGD